MDYVALLDMTETVTAGIRENIQALVAKRGKKVPGCTKEEADVTIFHRVRRLVRFLPARSTLGRLTQKNRRVPNAQVAQYQDASSCETAWYASSQVWRRLL